MDLNKIGSFISSLRKQKEMTQMDLAEMIGVTDKAISRWETGKGFPDVSLLTTLADALDVSVTDIIYGEKIELNEKNSAEIMETAIINTLDYSQREISISKRWRRVAKGVALVGFCVLVFFGIYAQSFINFFSDQYVKEVLHVLLIIFIIPIGTPVLMYVFKRERIWLSPIIVFATCIVVSILFEPAYIGWFRLVFFSDYNDGSTTNTVLGLLTRPMLTSIFGIIVCKIVDAFIVRSE